jgi:hypothetical protein
MLPRFTWRPPGSSRLLVFAVGWSFLACLSAPGVTIAGPIPREPLPPLELPLSSECHEAVRTYMEERQWSLDHFDQDLPVSLFKQHRISMADAWYVAEIECGIDIDQDGRLG